MAHTDLKSHTMKIQFQSQKSKFAISLTLLLVVGYLLRHYLAFVVFKNQGFAWDMAAFANWQESLRDWGYDVFTYNPSFNYPSVFAAVLASINGLGDLLAPIFFDNHPNISRWSLLKLPSILADVGVGASLALFGRKWFGARVGLWAAAMYLFLPVSWYDSAIWGQVDSLAALPMLLAVFFAIDKKYEVSAIFLVVAVLIKPQGILIVLVVLPLLIGLLLRKEISLRRVGSIFLAGLFSFVLLASPWSLQRYAPENFQSVPILGDLLGIAGQAAYSGALFPVATANAYNIWALAGTPSLAKNIETNRVYWINDQYDLFGAPIWIIGLFLFFAACAFVWIRVQRDASASTVLIGYSVLLMAFYVFPTRVHERYLAQAFTVLALVLAGSAINRWIFAALNLANTINMHAILAAPLKVVQPFIQPESQGSSFPPSSYNGSPAIFGLSDVNMPLWGSREYPIVMAVITIQTLAALYLMRLRLVK